MNKTHATQLYQPLTPHNTRLTTIQNRPAEQVRISTSGALPATKSATIRAVIGARVSPICPCPNA